MRLRSLALLAALAVPVSLRAQAAPPAEVMVLGMYHFANPGLDVVKTQVADVLSPQKQAEVAAVEEALARFRPTRIAVEDRSEHAARLDSTYAAYRAGRHALSRNETEQLGFRLAARFGHARLWPIDHDGAFPFEEMMAYAARHDTATVARVGGLLREVGVTMDSMQRTRSVAGILQWMNDPATLREAHGHYVSFAAVGAGDGYAGANLLSAWYERNLRMFANIRRVAQPGERVLVIVGQGHAPILRELVSYDAGLRLVEPNAYLPQR